MAMTAPGMRPASMSAFSTALIRASRSEEKPTSSGLARGSGSSASAALDANRQNPVARIRKLAMDASRWGFLPSLLGADYGSGLPEASDTSIRFRMGRPRTDGPYREGPASGLRNVSSRRIIHATQTKL